MFPIVRVQNFVRKRNGLQVINQLRTNLVTEVGIKFLDQFHAETVERRDHHARRGRADVGAQAILHGAYARIGKRQAQNPVGRRSGFLDDVSNAYGQHLRFPGPRAGNDHNRTVNGIYGCALGGI